jgi:metallophosphoesterase superfamily enzyme
LPKGSYRYPALVMNKDKMIMPAFGTFTGGHLIKSKSFDKIILCTGRECVELN